ncbi:cobalbumin biosynthesis protein [Syntrophobotulus glycolicus DSM 8271]|uniref:Cobalbumin biosynthesis protein n=1 Tax=Syntrophobotulus glycolicus (strain DSM 8271 / FlGlyR) TaxID=645991 RepID=F0SZ51_SYNGF|nr:bifunctional adenosylcobinamide kinase/adenosylcobinamide-phosphate guanylyltransferase [Syntrophobotulus glycolicus]ADY57169.1 cobalbumin biosynthesis protein [Syntrophobotulus glycolicus DSM 8271]
MILILGGRYQGKTAYALKNYGSGTVVFDLAGQEITGMYGAGIIVNLQEGVRQLIRMDIRPEEYFRDNLAKLAGKILVGTEIGCGIVPVEKADRAWRDETGRVYQLLAANAQKVERVWAGIPVTLKSDPERC